MTQILSKLKSFGTNFTDGLATLLPDRLNKAAFCLIVVCLICNIFVTTLPLLGWAAAAYYFINLRIKETGADK